MGLFNKKLSDDELLQLVKDNDNGNPDAQQKFADLFDNEPGFIDRVCKARLQIYKNGAYAGERNAILMYALSLCHLGRKKEGIEWYMKQINKGDTDAMLELSLQYSDIGALGPDPDKEFYWMKKAAEKGNADAQYQVGRELFIAGNKIGARLWYERSANKNFPEGLAAFAGCLLEEKQSIWELMNGIDHADGYADYLTKKYGKLSTEEWEKVMRNLYVQAQKIFIQALNKTKEDSTAGMCCSKLSNLYLFPPKGIAPRPYLAAYYSYADYLETGSEYGLDNCKRIIKEKRLKVTDADLREWEQMSIWDWGKKHHITL